MINFHVQDFSSNLAIPHVIQTENLSMELVELRNALTTGQIGKSFACGHQFSRVQIENNIEQVASPIPQIQLQKTSGKVSIHFDFTENN